MVGDLDAHVAGLAQRGIETGEIAWVVPGSARSAWVVDPEGNRIQIGEAPDEEA